MREELDQLLEEEWAGSLSEAGRARLEALALADPALHGRLRSERGLTRLLQRCGPNHAPAGLSRAVLAQLATGSAAGRVQRRASFWQKLGLPNWTPAFGLGFAATCLLVLGGFYVVQLRQHGSAPANLVAQGTPAVPSGAADRELAKALPGDDKRADLDKKLEDSAKSKTARAQGDLKPALPAELKTSTAEPALPPADASPQPANERAEPVPSPTPAPTTTVEQAVVSQPGASPAANDLQRLPEKMRPKLPAMPSEDAAVDAVAAPAAPPAAPSLAGPAQVEIEMQLASASAGAAAPAMAQPRGSAKMRVSTQGFVASAGAPALPDQVGAAEGGGSTAGVTLKDVEILLTSVGATELNHAPVGGQNAGQWRVTCQLTRAQLRQFTQDLQRERIQPATSANALAPNTYVVQTGHSALNLGTDMTSGQQPVKLTLIVHE